MRFIEVDDVHVHEVGVVVSGVVLDIRMESIITNLVVLVTLVTIVLVICRI